MALIIGGLRAAGRGALGIGRTALTGGPIGRAALGGVIGGIGGAVRGDFENPNLRAESIFTGAMWGAGIGFTLGAGFGLGRGVIARAPRAAATGIRDYFKRTWTVNQRAGEEALRRKMGNYLGLGQGPITPQQRFHYSPIARNVRGLARIPLQAGSLAIRHPFVTAGLIGGTYAGASALAGGPYESPTLTQSARLEPRYEQEAMAASMVGESWIAPVGAIGTAPQMMGPMQRAMQRSTTGLVQGLHQSRHS